MIDKINFMGRETMLTAGLKGGIKRYDYVSDAKIYSKKEIQKLMDEIDAKRAPKYEIDFQSPYAPVAKSSKAAASVDFVPETASIDFKA